MTMRPSHAHRLGLGATVAAALLAAAGGARADVSLRYQPQYLDASTRTTDAAGATVQADSTAFDQKLVFDLNQPLYPALRLSVNGLYDWVVGTTDTNGIPGELDARNLNLYGVLKAGDRTLNGGVDYTRTQLSTGALVGPAAVLAPTRVTERYGVFGLWAVPELPRVDLRVSRTNQFDSSRRLADLTEDDVSANVLYSVREWDLSYRLRWSHPVDQLSGADTTMLTHTGFVGYAARLLADRVAVAANYQLQAQSIDTRVSSSAASESRPVPVVQGLSAIDTGTSPVPGQLRLDPNPALVDGDFETGAGLDIGYRPAISGDVNPRNMGVQVQDLTTRIDALYVYVDRPLPPTIAAAYAWEAYRSDDNLTWTPVAITGTVAFGTFRNRFEIPLAPTTGSRYV